MVFTQIIRSFCLVLAWFSPGFHPVFLWFFCGNFVDSRKSYPTYPYSGSLESFSGSLPTPHGMDHPYSHEPNQIVYPASPEGMWVGTPLALPGVGLDLLEAGQGNLAHLEKVVLVGGYRLENLINELLLLVERMLFIKLSDSLDLSNDILLQEKLEKPVVYLLLHVHFSDILHVWVDTDPQH